MERYIIIYFLKTNLQYKYKNNKMGVLFFFKNLTHFEQKNEDSP